MTDISDHRDMVPGRFGINAALVDGQLQLTLETQPEILVNGVLRASVLAYVIDAAAGITVDESPDVWTLTTDMTLRMQPVPAPAFTVGSSTLVRRGRRSVTSTVEVVGPEGEPILNGAIGFAAIPRKEGDPPKPMVTPENAAVLFNFGSVLTEPLREAADIRVLDAAEGVAEVTVTPKLRNPAGTLQGAMVALLAEVAAEEWAATRTDKPVVVTDLDLRYLAQAPDGPVRTITRPLGQGPDAPLEIQLVDTSVDRLTTLVYARATVLDC